MVLNDLIIKSGRNFPRKPAIIYGKEVIAYRELVRKVDRMAAGLLSLEVKSGDRIALYIRNRPEFVITYFAALKVGAIPVPFNYFWKEEELRFVLTDSGAKILVTEPEFLEISRNLQSRIGTLKKVVLLAKDVPPPAPEGPLPYDSLFQEPKRPFPIIAGSDVAVLIYTSGTTGFPKGVMLTHENLLSNVESCQKTVRLYEKDRFLCLLPMFHTFAFTVCILVPLSLASPIFIIPAGTPFRNTLKEILKRRITIFVGIPDFYRLLSEIKLSWWAQCFLSLFNPIRLAISGAAALPPETLTAFQRRFRIPLLEGYGLTEASPVVTLNPLKKRKPGSIGLPIAGVEVKVFSPEGKEIPVNQVGELVVRGKNVMAGYYNRLQETQETIKDGWLYTGDLARKDEDGYFFLVDRKKDMINFRGLNIYPREVETVLYRHPAVKETAVVGVPGAGGEIPVAYVVLKDEQPVSAEEMLHFLRQHLAGYKVPRRIIFRDGLPHTATGKVAKKELMS